MKFMLPLILCAAACTSSGAPSASSAPSALPSAAAPAKPNGANAVPVIITVSDARPLADVVRDLEERGLFVEQKLDTVHIVSGKVSEDNLDRLQGVGGVLSVERETMFETAAPGSAKAE